MKARPAAKAKKSNGQKVDGKAASPYGYPFWDWVAKEDPDYIRAREPVSELSLGARVVGRDTGNPRTTGARFEPRSLVDALLETAGTEVRLGVPLQDLPDLAPVVLANCRK